MMEISRIMDNFVEAAAKHGQGIDSGNSILANKSYDQVVENYDLLKKLNKEIYLINLLDHENYSVKLWAARYCLNIDSRKAIKAFEEVISLDLPGVSFRAEITLQEWEAGNLSF